MGSVTVHNEIVKGSVIIPQSLLDIDFDYVFELVVPEDNTTEGIVVCIDGGAAQPSITSVSDHSDNAPSVQFEDGVGWLSLAQNPDGIFTLDKDMERFRIHMKDGWSVKLSNVPLGTRYKICGYVLYEQKENSELATTSTGSNVSDWPALAGTINGNEKDVFIEHRYIRGELQLEKEVRDDSGAGADPGREYAFELALRHEVTEGTPVQASPGVRVVEGEGGAVERLAFRARDAHGLQATVESAPLFVDGAGSILDRRLSVAAADGSGEASASGLPHPAGPASGSDGDGSGGSDAGAGGSDDSGAGAADGAQVPLGASGAPSDPVEAASAVGSEGAPEAAGPAAGEWRSGVVLRFTLRHGDRLTLPSLPEGLAYEVRELVPDDFGGEAPYVCIPAERRGTIKGNAEEAVPKADECGFLNVVSPGEGGYVRLAVEKRWVLLDGSGRGPTDVTVLVRGLDGELIDQVTLRARESARHGWRHAFTLPKRTADGKLAVYSLEEAPAEGFAAEYSTDGESGATVITNTEIGPDDPAPPGPTNPDDPNTPDGPGSPDDPTGPNPPAQDDPTTGDPATGEPAAGSGDASGAAAQPGPVVRRIRVLAQTGDPAFCVALGLLAAAVTAIICVAVLSRRKE